VRPFDLRGLFSSPFSLAFYRKGCARRRHSPHG
jgi:hypothetical protein